MVGDVNVYMNDSDDLELAEVENMIAEQKRYYLSMSVLHLVVAWEL
jgi:hypothetical protein